MNRIVNFSSKEKSSLLRTPFLGAVDEEAALSLVDAASLQTFAPRHLLFREGDPAEYLYCVLTGYVRLFRTAKDGREADVRICGPGETFNDCLIFGAEQNRYSAQIAESCTLARLELGKIKAMIEADTKVAKAVIESLSKSALTSMECVANDRLQTALQRVAHYLVTHAPGEKGSYSLRLPFQKSVLAGKLGLAPEALSRAFSSLRDCGVIVRGRVIQIKDMAALRQI